MQSRSRWYEHIESEVATLRLSLGEKEAKRHKLAHLLKVAGRVDEFSGTCGECQLKQQEITQLVPELALLLQSPDKRVRKAYKKQLDLITKHLQKEHKLVSKGYYMGIWTGIGIAIGSGIGTAIGNPGIGSGLGIAIGLAVGTYLDKKAEREGRVL